MKTTFTKLFSSITDSTIWCESSDVRIVWITMLAMCDKEGYVGASIPGLANRAQVSIAVVEEALTKFLSPDPYSRTKEFDGRRIKEGDGGWYLLNHPKYRALRHTEERKEYKREWMRKHRQQQEVDNIVDFCGQSGPSRTYTDTDTDTDTKNNKRGVDSPQTTLPKKNRHFVPPNLNQLRQYVNEHNLTNVDVEEFFYFYDSKDWMVGKNKMKRWTSALSRWNATNAKTKPEIQSILDTAI